MGMLPLLIAGIAALAIVVIAVGIAMSAGGGGVSSRLERYASGKDPGADLEDGDSESSPPPSSAEGSRPDAYRSSRADTPPPPALMAMPTAMTTIANAAIPAIRSGSMPMVCAVPSG